MGKRVAIVGIGTTGFRATTPDVSYRELTYEAAVKAYLDAGIEPKEVGAFVATSEDFIEGYSISDEYSPDQLGAVLRPIHTVPGDFLQSLANGMMLVQSGFADLVVVQGLSKASNILNVGEVLTFAEDPVTVRPLRETPHAVAALDMCRFLHETGTTREQCAQVVVKNRRNALRNQRAAHGTLLEACDVLAAPPVAEPLGRYDIAQHADGAVVVVLASEERAAHLRRAPVWIRGIGWATDAPSLDSRVWGDARYARLAADMAYRMAGIRTPRREIQFAEVNDEYSYKELQHLEALRIYERGQAGRATEVGATEPAGEFPVNVSGGSLGCGATFDLDGGQKLLEVVLQLRGEAGTPQLRGVTTGLAASWRGVPSATGAVAVLSN
ncbi:MAG: acetyl-CoA acetyltransferase [Myxococcota bacterium]|nr:acetyl-CoA acetyltransferase [Myxococcota bacterium]